MNLDRGQGRPGVTAAAAALALLASAGPAMASAPFPVPEPGTLSLLAGGAIAAVYLVHRRRK